LIFLGVGDGSIRKKRPGNGFSVTVESVGVPHASLIDSRELLVDLLFDPLRFFGVGLCIACLRPRR